MGWASASEIVEELIKSARVLKEIINVKVVVLNILIL
jgi:hypothetical protein